VNDLLYVSDVSPYRAGRDAPAMAGVHQSLGSAATALEEIAGLCGLGFRHARQVRDIGLEDLERARLLALFTIGETPWSQDQRDVIERRASSGALGIVGLHSATDAAYQWPAMGSLLGGRFNGHPITGDLPMSSTCSASSYRTHACCWRWNSAGPGSAPCRSRGAWSARRCEPSTPRSGISSPRTRTLTTSGMSSAGSAGCSGADDVRRPIRTGGKAPRPA
jgi:Trehalose utilisation